MARKISQAGITLIKSFEGCRLTAYKPVAAETYWTIGWGHYGPDVKQGMTITQAEADAMLVKDLAKYEAYVNNPAYVPITAQLTQNQFDALVSFCYNCGAGNLKTLCTGRTAAEIAASIPKYNKGSGQVLAGLVRRRAAEVALFNKEDETDMAESKPSKTGFKDVPAGNWAEDAILAAKAAGIMAGKSADTFGFGQPVTREELAAVVAKLLERG